MQGARQRAILDEQLFSFAENAARKVISLLNLLPIPDGEIIVPSDRRWQIHYAEIDRDIKLFVKLRPSANTVLVIISLGTVMVEILRDLREIVECKEGSILLNLKLPDEEKSEPIFAILVGLGIEYVMHLPITFYHSFFEGINESMISFVKKSLEPRLREYWMESGKPKRFSLIPNRNLLDLKKLLPDLELASLNQLDMNLREFAAYRRNAFADRKINLSPELLIELPAKHEELRLAYRETKKDHKITFKAFFQLNRRAKREDWEQYWDDHCEQHYPNLTETNSIPDYSPAELACRQLANLFDFSVGHMERLITAERKRKKEKSVFPDQSNGKKKFVLRRLKTHRLVKKKPKS